MTDPLFFKALDAKASLTDDESREFTAIVAAFNTIDDENDVILPGAFADEIGRLERSGQTLPVIYNHQHNDLRAFVGEVLDIAELDGDDERLRTAPHLIGKGGLWVHGRIDDDNPNNDAGALYKSMKAGRINQFSFVAMKGNATEVEMGDRTVRAIDTIGDMVEVGPTIRGMNTNTTLLSIKSRLGTVEATQLDPIQATPEPAVTAGDRARLLALLTLYPNQ